MAIFNKETNTITCTGEIFIIPNSSSLITSFMDDYQETLKKYIDKTAELSGLRKFDPASDMIAEFWWASQSDLDKYDPNDPETSPEDPEHSNLVRHGFSIKDDEGTVWYSKLEEEYLPKYFFDNVKEGDTINMKYPIKLGNDKKEKINAVLDMELTCTQLRFRYANRGNFHDLLARV